MTNKNVRKLENGQVLNIGSITPNRQLILKAMEGFSLSTSNEVQMKVKEILRDGVVEDYEDSYTFCLHNQCIKLDTALRKVVDFFDKNAPPVKVSSMPPSQSYEFDSLLPDVTLQEALLTISTEVNRIEDYTVDLRKSLSRIDKAVSEVYHEIEMTNLSASKGYLLAKKLQLLLRERRLIKNTLKHTNAIQVDVHSMKQSISSCELKLENVF